MAEIINLRQARKRKTRADAQSQAAENRALHGQSAGQKTTSKLTRQLEAKRLDAHRRQVGTEPGEPSG